jgi:Putative F0F1-ATPase subunit Ca2+/Mg2+ transporter
MKRLSPPRVTPNDTMGQGIDNALAVALLFGIGFGLDRWLGTTPWLMIVLSLVGAVGVFAKMKYRYDAQMAEHEAERQERLEAGRSRERAASDCAGSMRSGRGTP